MSNNRWHEKILNISDDKLKKLWDTTISSEMDVKSEDSKDDATIVNKIIELVTEFPQGVSDKVLIANMPTVDPKARALVINKLLMAEKIDLFNGKDGLLYRKREPSKAGSIAGDQEEKVVYKIIEGAGNIGVWIRDIRAKSNLGQTQLNKVLKSLETKNLIKSVKSVNASKKKVCPFLLFSLILGLLMFPLCRSTCCSTCSQIRASLVVLGIQRTTLNPSLWRF